MEHHEKMALDRYITREPPDPSEGNCRVCGPIDAVASVLSILDGYGVDARKAKGRSCYGDVAVDELVSSVRELVEVVAQREAWGVCPSCEAEEHAAEMERRADERRDRDA